MSLWSSFDVTDPAAQKASFYWRATSLRTATRPGLTNVSSLVLLILYKTLFVLSAGDTIDPAVPLQIGRGEIQMCRPRPLPPPSFSLSRVFVQELIAINVQFLRSRIFKG